VGEGNPNHFGCVLISGLCLRFEVDEFNIAEFSVFPYYWGGTDHGDAAEKFRSLQNRFLGMGIYFRNDSQVQGFPMKSGLWIHLKPACHRCPQYGRRASGRGDPSPAP